MKIPTKHMLAKTRDKLLTQNLKNPKQKDNNGYKLTSSIETFIQNSLRKISLTYWKGHLPQKSILRETSNRIP